LFIQPVCGFTLKKGIDIIFFLALKQAFSPALYTIMRQTYAFVTFVFSLSYYLLIFFQQFKQVLMLSPKEKDSPVLSIDVYQSVVARGFLGRIVVATADLRVTVYSLSCSGSINLVFSRACENFQIISAKFCKRSRDVYMFELNGGRV
jgi:hypothetical protein